MKTLMFLLLLGICIYGGEAVTHSMTYIVTAATGVREFPEHNEVGLVDGQEFVHFDSRLMKIIPKTDWIEKNVDADYWERETQRNINTQQVFKGNIDILMKRFNQTGGVHIFQWLYGCEWEEETNELNAFHQFGYDGEDFIALDLKTDSWIAPTAQAVITKHKWEDNKEHLRQKPYYTQICPEWLKKYLDYGKSSLQRKVLPSVALLQKPSSSRVSCHATGFYPNRADLLWRKNGVELHEAVDKGEILPNNDGTFQMSVDLDLSAITSEDWKSYDCVFQLSGVNKDIVKKLDKAVIRTNVDGPSAFPIPAVVGGVFGGLVGIMVILGLATLVYKKCLKKGNNGFKPANNSDTSSSSSDGSDTKKVPAEERKMINSTACK